MTVPEVATYGMNIVLRGGFNPAIFQPAWFSAETILPRGEADAAKVDIISLQLTSFSTEWLLVQVTEDRFSARTQLAHMELSLRDFVLATFRLLRHTPINVMGINRDAHYNMGSTEAWHKIGHTLAPKEKWQGLLVEPGTRSLTIEGQRPDKYRGFVRVRIEPSNVVVENGLFVEINDHYDFSNLTAAEDIEGAPDQTPIIGSSRMLDALEADWDQAAARAKAIMEWVRKFQ
jgi:hypothetical protein